MARTVLVPTRKGDAPLIREIAEGLKSRNLPCDVSLGLEEASKQKSGQRWSYAIGIARRLVQASDEPCILVGYSLGALVAARVAIAMPARITGLVLIAPVVEIRGRAALAKGTELDGLVPFLERMEHDTDRDFLQGEDLVGRLPIAPVVIQGRRDDISPPWAGECKRVLVDDDHLFRTSRTQILDAVEDEINRVIQLDRI